LVAYEGKQPNIVKLSGKGLQNIQLLNTINILDIVPKSAPYNNTKNKKL